MRSVKTTVPFLSFHPLSDIFFWSSSPFLLITYITSRHLPQFSSSPSSWVLPLLYFLSTSAFHLSSVLISLSLFLRTCWRGCLLKDCWLMCVAGLQLPRAGCRRPNEKVTTPALSQSSDTCSKHIRYLFIYLSQIKCKIKYITMFCICMQE